MTTEDPCKIHDSMKPGRAQLENSNPNPNFAFSLQQDPLFTEHFHSQCGVFQVYESTPNSVHCSTPIREASPELCLVPPPSDWKVCWGGSTILWRGVWICERQWHDKLGRSEGMLPRKILKSGTSEMPFPGFSGWIWGKKGGLTEPIKPPLDPPQVCGVVWSKGMCRYVLCVHK